MDTQVIESAPCPFCGERTFSLGDTDPAKADYAFLWAEHDDPAHIHSRECHGCGQIQLLVTKC